VAAGRAACRKGWLWHGLNVRSILERGYTRSEEAPDKRRKGREDAKIRGCAPQCMQHSRATRKVATDDLMALTLCWVGGLGSCSAAQPVGGHPRAM